MLHDRCLWVLSPPPNLHLLNLQHIRAVIHHICMSAAVCPASRNFPKMHKFLFLCRENFCVGEEDLLGKPGCKVPFHRPLVLALHCSLHGGIMCFVVPPSLFHCGSGYVWV